MPIDTSIYGNIRPVETPDLMGAVQKGMALSHLGMQNRQMQQQADDQAAVRSAFSRNVGPDGQLNRQAALSEITKTAPMQAMALQNQWAQQDKTQAETKSAQMEAMGKIAEQTLPHLEYLKSLPPDQAQKLYPSIMSNLAHQGVPMHNVPPEFSQDWLNQTMGTLQNSKANLERMKTISEIQQAPAKLNTEMYGSRSPNATLTDQYTADVKPIRSSQMAMRQMIDNYNHPSPQGDASLILNAFKIKFPTAPDVNSLKELSESQSASDAWKNMAHKGLEGGLDQGTRDNLMRDGVSTFRANTETLRDYQDKYKGRAQAQNVNDTSFLAEPAVDKTYADAMKLQSKIGPYVPPAERGGVLAGVNKFISGALGGAGEKTASAQEKPQPKIRETGSKVSADEVAQYATRHKMKLSAAQKFLKGQGYAVD